MLPAFIIWLVKKYFTKTEQRRYIKLLLYRLAAAVAGVLFCSTAFPQELIHKYAVVYNNGNVGSMQLYTKKTGDDVYMKMVSDVQMRVVFKIAVRSEEEASFKKGRLVFSRAYRRVNGKEKVNNQTRAVGDVYQTSGDGKTGCIRNKLIDYNFIMLYNHEPVNIQTVYSDSFQQFITIEKTADHTYKVALPDGNYNYYFFSNGICNKVEVHHSLYTITIKLLS